MKNTSETLKTELRNATRELLTIAISHLIKDCGFTAEELGLQLDIHQELGLRPDQVLEITTEADTRQRAEKDLPVEIQESLQGIRDKIQKSLNALSAKTIAEISSEITHSIMAIIGLISKQNLAEHPSVINEIRELTRLSSSQRVWELQTQALREKKKQQKKTDRDKKKRLARRQEKRSLHREAARSKRKELKPPKIPTRNGCTKKKTFSNGNK